MKKTDRPSTKGKPKTKTLHLRVAAQASAAGLINSIVEPPGYIFKSMKRDAKGNVVIKYSLLKTKGSK